MVALDQTLLVSHYVLRKGVVSVRVPAIKGIHGCEPYRRAEEGQSRACEGPVPSASCNVLIAYFAFASTAVLMSDPNWNRGFYYAPGSLPPHTGMKLARQIATITYRSGPEWEQRFGRGRRRAPGAGQAAPPSLDGQALQHHGAEQDPALCPDFLIETYLDHQVGSLRPASACRLAC